MICNTIGLTTDSFETLYVHGDAEVPEVYGGLNYTKPIFYSLKTLTGATSYSFMGYPEPLKSYEISGNMVQSGTPTPTSPIYPQECGDRTENLFDAATLENGIYLAASGNKYGDVTNGVRSGTKIKALPNTAYTLSAQSSKIVALRILEWNNGTFVKQTPIYNISGSVSLTVTTTSETTEIAFNIEGENGQYTTNIMLNTGSNPLPYEPYGYKLPIAIGGVTQSIYLTEPLRKIGDYADSISGDGAVERKIKKLVLDGTENWTYRSGSHANVFFMYLPTAKTGEVAMSNAYPYYSGTDFVDMNDKEFAIIRSNLAIRNSDYQYESQFKAYLAAQYANGTPVTVWYVLATPTTEQVTAPALTPTTGNNTLAIGTTLQPSSLSITGHIKPSS